MADLRDAVASMRGRSIVSASFEEHVGPKARTLLSVWLDLDGSGLRFRTAPTGWGLVTEAEPPKEADLGEYGRIEVSDAGLDRGMALGRVDAVWMVFSTQSPCPVGVRWRVAGVPAVVVYGYDDELIVGGAPDPELGTMTYDEVAESR